MKAPAIATSSLKLLQWALQVNFNASVIFMLVASAMSIAGSELFFEDSSDLYGPLANNMRFVLFYLCLTQLAVYGFYVISANHGAALGLGVFFLLLTISLEFYATINQIDIDQNYQKLLVYSGLSHTLYGGLCSCRSLHSSSN
ncbi:MAG: hypothetical protein KGZ80_04480 [Methylomonas sp.]|nr:hypothetical protein [Methylomonas sp.]PPD22050.1 MAG: hypothetical protein CTY23_03055 [Methylomonas sp.]PPD25242.1 MAG: hypothetical protein CTY22_09345 [Methylomonas sp.]PPD35193.1 MAG: hypothetical protein CTY21_09345 [Methylomonas sp.]PPD42462.1 MAG: hypothetical protein CTY17_01615 [Methylomonas sp.]